MSSANGDTSPKKSVTFGDVKVKAEPTADTSSAKAEQSEHKHSPVEIDDKNDYGDLYNDAKMNDPINVSLVCAMATLRVSLRRLRTRRVRVLHAGNAARCVGVLRCVALHWRPVCVRNLLLQCSSVRCAACLQQCAQRHRTPHTRALQ